MVGLATPILPVPLNTTASYGGQSMARQFSRTSIVVWERKSDRALSISNSKNSGCILLGDLPEAKIRQKC